MNGARITFMRRGYLLTALAAAVLLAASPGIASAQSIGFVGTSATMGEGASASALTAEPVMVEIDVSGLTLSGPGANRTTAFGTLTIQHDADLEYPGQAVRTAANQRIWLDTTSSALDEDAIDLTALTAAAAPNGHLYGVPDDLVLPYDNNGVIRLVLIDPGGDGNWVDNRFTMRLVTAANPTDGPIPPSPSPASFIVTVTDKDPQATVSFTPSEISLTEGSETAAGSQVTLSLEAGNPRTTTDNPAGLNLLTNQFQFTASPRGAVVVSPDGVASACDATHDRDVISVKLTNITYTAATGVFAMDNAIGGITPTDAPSFEVEACRDDSGFQDGMVTFSFVGTSLSGMPRGIGDIAGNTLTVTVQSNEAVPTVQFGTSSISVDEGSTETVAIVADSATGAEVESVTVHKSGYAMLSLWQDGEMLESDDGEHYEVDMMGSSNTILTVSADSDRDLEDGMTSTATLTIESANGANIGDGNSVMVTVMGSTAVPALPLVGQLLLALFLMAGGARLYRRR